VYGRVEGSRFSPLDLGGLAEAGLAIGSSDGLVAGRPV